MADQNQKSSTSELNIRLRLHDQARIGPGKIALLETVRQAGSVAAAGAAMEMSPRRAWLLIDSLNRAFELPLVELSEPDSLAASEATLTQFGQQIVDAYRAVERDAEASVDKRFADVLGQVKPGK